MNQKCSPNLPTEIDIDSTRSVLAELQSECKTQNALLVVLLVPDRKDLEEPGNMYLNSLALFRQLEIEFIEVRDRLVEFDYAPRPDIHWNDSGHKK